MKEKLPIKRKDYPFLKLVNHVNHLSLVFLQAFSECQYFRQFVSNKKEF